MSLDRQIDEELPAWIAALAAGVACLAYAWWLAWRRPHV